MFFLKMHGDISFKDHYWHSE